MVRGREGKREGVIEPMLFVDYLLASLSLLNGV